jgi:hypothetical protein
MHVKLTWSQKWNPDSEHPNIRPALIVEEPIIHLKGAGSNILTRNPKRRLANKKGYKKDSDKSEGAGAAMHQVYSVMDRAGPKEWILDSGAFAYMTGIKSLLKNYEEVATTTVTAANGDILPAKGSWKYLLQDRT